MNLRFTIFSLMFFCCSIWAGAASFSIAGPSTACRGELNTYTLSSPDINLSNCLIFWSFPAGSSPGTTGGSTMGPGLTSLDIAFTAAASPGLITVNITCPGQGNCPAVTKSVAIEGIASISMTGPTAVDAGLQVLTYTASAASLDNTALCANPTYTWSLAGLPTWNIVSGQGTNSLIVATSNYSGGIMTVTVSCEGCPSTTDAVSSRFISRNPPEISCSASTSDACIGDPVTVTATLPMGLPANSPSWTVVNGSCGSCNNLSQVITPTGNGPVTATVTVNYPAGLISTCSTTFWSGPPATPVITYQGFPDCVTPNSNLTFYASTNFADQYIWSLPNCGPQIPSPLPNPECWFSYDPLSSANSHINLHAGIIANPVISVSAKNECGSTSSNLEISLCNVSPPGGGDGPGPGPGGIIIKNVSLDQGHNTLEAKVYPVPFEEIVNIQLTEIDARAYPELELLIFDASGKILKQQTFEPWDYENIEVNTSELISGIYFITLRNGSENVLSRKITKK